MRPQALLPQGQAPEGWSRAGHPQDLTSLPTLPHGLRLPLSGPDCVLTARSPLPPCLPAAILPAHCNADPCRPAEVLPSLGDRHLRDTGRPGQASL